MTVTTFDWNELLTDVERDELRDALQITIRTTDGKIAALREACVAGKIYADEYKSQRAELLAIRKAAHRRLMALG